MAVDYLPTLADAPLAAAIPGLEERRQRERIAAALMMQGGSGEPIKHWTQGLNRVAQGLVGGYQLGELRRQGEAEEARTQAILAGLGMPGGTGTPSAAIPQRAAESDSPAPAPMTPAARPAMDPRARGIAALSDPGVMASKPGVNRVLDISTAVPTGYTLPPDRGAKVASTDRVVGDDEGVRLGYYDAPKTPGARPPNQPDAAALTSPTQPGATPVPTQAIRPEQVAQARQPAAAAASPATAEMALARALMANPPTRAAGLQMYMKAVEQMKPNYGFQVIGDTIYRTDPRGGQAIPLATAPQKPGLHSFKLPNGDEITVERDAQGRLTIPKVEGLPIAPTAGAGALPAPPPGLSKKAREEWEKEQVKLEVTKQGQRPGELRSAKIVVDDIDRAMQQADEGFVTGISGQILSKVGGTAAHDLAGRLQSIKANISIDKLNAMRAASPTGGALGNVTEGEHALLSATLGSVEQSQSKEQFKENLGRLKEFYNEIIHGGVGKGPPETGRLPARISGKAEYDALPSGAKYIAPDGSVRTKK